MRKERTDSRELSSDFLPCALAPTLLQLNKCQSDKWADMEPAGLRLWPARAVMGFFPRQKLSYCLVCQWEHLSPSWAVKGGVLTFRAAWRSPELPGSKELLSAQPFYAREHLVGVRAPVLTTLSALLCSAPASYFPRENGWLLFQAVPCRQSLPSLANFHRERGYEAYSLGSRWYLPSVSLIAKNHPIWTV